MALQEIASGLCSLKVYDVDTFSKDLIGLFETDLMDLYTLPNHEIYRQWAPLTAPLEARAGLFSTADGGLTGYVKFSMQLVGPEDVPRAHEDEDDEEDNETVLLPPAMKRDMIFLCVLRHASTTDEVAATVGYRTPFDTRAPPLGRRIAVIRAEWLMELANMVDRTVDPYVELVLDGNKKRTMRFDNNNNPVFNLEFWFPVLVPQGVGADQMAPGKRLKITLYDWNLTTAREKIYEWNLPVGDILSACTTGDGTDRKFHEKPQLLWHNLYRQSTEAQGTPLSRFVASLARGFTQPPLIDTEVSSLAC